MHHVTTIACIGRANSMAMSTSSLNEHNHDIVGGKRSNNMNFSVVASNNHIIVDEPLAIFQP